MKEILCQLNFYQLLTYPKKENIPIKEHKLKRERIKRQNLIRKSRTKNIL